MNEHPDGSTATVSTRYRRFLRITNNIQQRDTLRNLGQQLKQVNESLAQVGSGLRVQKPSDDPVATGQILRADGQLRALDQYRRNINIANSRLSLEDEVLGKLTSMLEEAGEIAAGQLSPTADENSRRVAQRQIQELISSARQLGNTRLGSLYIFGGDQGGSPPFGSGTVPAPDISPQGVKRIEIGQNQFLSTNHSAEEVFNSSGLLPALSKLHDALATPDGDDSTGKIGEAISAVEDAFANIQSLLAEVGSRMNVLDLAATNAESFEVNMRSIKSSLQDADLTEAITHLVNRQVAYQAALLATSRVIQTTLADYLI